MAAVLLIRLLIRLLIGSIEGFTVTVQASAVDSLVEVTVIAALIVGLISVITLAGEDRHATMRSIVEEIDVGQDLLRDVLLQVRVLGSVPSVQLVQDVLSQFLRELDALVLGISQQGEHCVELLELDTAIQHSLVGQLVASDTLNSHVMIKLLSCFDLLRFNASLQQTSVNDQTWSDTFLLHVF